MAELAKICGGGSEEIQQFAVAILRRGHAVALLEASLKMASVAPSNFQGEARALMKPFGSVFHDGISPQTTFASSTPLPKSAMTRIF